MERWLNTSTATLEAYVKEAPSGTAIVFRFKEPQAAYDGHVIVDGQVRSAGLPFPSRVDAQTWAEQQLGDEFLEERSVSE